MSEGGRRNITGSQFNFKGVRSVCAKLATDDHDGPEEQEGNKDCDDDGGDDDDGHNQDCDGDDDDAENEKEGLVNKTYNRRASCSPVLGCLGAALGCFGPCMCTCGGGIF